MSGNRLESTARAQAETAAEAAAIRRRWITLGEIVAVIALIISGLTLWNSWSERRDTEAMKHADTRQASTRAVRLVLVAANAGGRVLMLKPASLDQSVQSQTVSFPGPLGVAPVQTTGEPRIDVGWFEHALKNAREAAKLPGDSRGDDRLPVAITTRMLVDGELHDDVALYDIGYSISGHWLGGHSIMLHGVSLVARAATGNVQAKLDARWKVLLAKK